MATVETGDDLVRLVSYLQHRVGDSLRGVYTYNRYGEFAVEYVRADLDGSFTAAELEDMLLRARSVDKGIHAESEDTKQEVEKFGAPMTSFHTYENTVVLQIYRGGEYGILAIFDDSIASTHTTFVKSVLETLPPTDND